ncbi:Rossmann-fold NAD(P)-binding domain-containing protein [Brevibacterium yomogidense]|uniref:hypothetical protein n=1 Tax=Brevibacterium yomogidense TaxID=946573 RepID=UPI0018DFD1A0|nr:hypothetical protein [Brevibacterium yomogidense]
MDPFRPHTVTPRTEQRGASVVNTSSVGARLFGRIDLDDLNTWQGFSPNRAYGNAKLANIVFVKGLYERFHDRGLSAVAFHPGMVATSFVSDTDSYFRRIYQGVLSRLLFSPGAGGARLQYFTDGAGVEVRRVRRQAGPNHPDVPTGLRSRQRRGAPGSQCRHARR